jgi:hypothetical protein
MKIKMEAFELYQGEKPYITARTSLGSRFIMKLRLKEGINPEEAENVVSVLNEYIKGLSIN